MKNIEIFVLCVVLWAILGSDWCKSFIAFHGSNTNQSLMESTCSKQLRWLPERYIQRYCPYSSPPPSRRKPLPPRPTTRLSRLLETAHLAAHNRASARTSTLFLTERPVLRAEHSSASRPTIRIAEPLPAKSIFTKQDNFWLVDTWTNNILIRKYMDYFITMINKFNYTNEVNL